MDKFQRKYPSVFYLREKAKKRIPKFAFEYLDGGCNNEESLYKNTDDIRNIQLKPKYIVEKKETSIKTKLFGIEYDAPFGVAPIGLQGLIWPKSPEILAKAAFDNNIPFILSTVTTASIEKISEISEGRSWFQLYHPAEEKVTKDILKRAHEAQCPVLIILADVPSFGYRPRDIRNGLSMPPKMTFNNIINAIKRPEWLMQTITNGQPSFEILKPYMPKNLNLSQLGKFMDATFSGRLNDEKIKKIRDLWKGKLVLKGAESLHDVEKAQSQFDARLACNELASHNQSCSKSPTTPTSGESLWPHPMINAITHPIVCPVLDLSAIAPRFLLSSQPLSSASLDH